MRFQPLWPVKKALGLVVATLKGIGELSVGTINEARKGTLLVVRTGGRTVVRTGKAVVGLGHAAISTPFVKVLKLGSHAAILLISILRNTSVAVIHYLRWPFLVTLGAGKLAVWPGLAYTIARTVARRRKEIGPLTASFVALEYLLLILVKRDRKLRELKHQNADTRRNLKFKAEDAGESNGLEQHVTAEELGALIAMGWQDMEDDGMEKKGNSAVSHANGHGHAQENGSMTEVAKMNGDAPAGSEGDSDERTAMVASIADRLVLYSTSVRAVRPTFEACNSVRQILQGYNVMLDERDLSMDLRFKNELKLLLRGKTIVPAVFVRGRHVGGLAEVQELDETNSLQPMLLGIKKLMSRKACVGCDGLRFVMCSTCDGSRKIRGKEGPSLCNDCNERGLQRCPFCV